MVRPITENRVANSRRGFLAVARKGQYLLILGRRRLDDLQVMMVGPFV